MRACEVYFHMEVSFGHQMLPEAGNPKVAVSAINRSNVGPVRVNLPYARHYNPRFVYFLPTF